MDLRKTLVELLTKGQKAQYPVATSSTTVQDSGQPIPNKYAPEIRIKLYKTPIVFTCINTIADQVAKVDWEIVPKKSVLDQFGYGTTEGKSVAVMTRKEWTQFTTKYAGSDRSEVTPDTKSHIEKIYALLENPNENMENFSSIVKKVAIDLKIHDAAAIEKTRNGVNEVAEIYTAPACYIRMNYDKNGKLLEPAYKQEDPKFSNNIVAEWSKDDLIYFMLNPISTSMYGVSPLDVIAQLVATLINALNYNGTYFESAALPEGFFTIPGVSENTVRRLMMKWEQEIKSKPHKVVFMPDGATWHQFRFNNVEMQWLQGQKFYMQLVMAVLGVTQHEIGFTEDINRATADNQSFVFKNKSLIPMLNLIADKINQELIGPNGFGFDDVMFVFKNVDLADKDTMDKIHDRAVKSGRMTINEAREEAGLRPYDGIGDQPVIATSQGLIFLEQFAMQFEDYKEERDWKKKEGKKLGLPASQVMANNGGNNNAANDNNTNNQPKTPPSAPRADQQPSVDESKPKAKNLVDVEGLRGLAEKVDKVINETNEELRETNKNLKVDKRASSKSSKE